MNNSEKEIIFTTIINQDLAKFKILLNENKNVDFNFTDDDGNTLLHFASDKKSENTLPLVQLLLECGCDPHAVNSRFETPLDRAKLNNNVPAMTVMKHFINIQNQENKDLL